MNKINLFLSAVLLMVGISAFAAPKTKSYTLKSPDGKIEVSVLIGDKISYSVNKNGTAIIAPSAISMTLTDAVLGNSPSIRSAKTVSVSATVPTPLYRQAYIEDRYNQLEIKFKEGFSLQMRAYCEGVAYRFCSAMKDSLTILGEQAEFNFDRDYTCYIPYSANLTQPFQTSFESRYDIAPISSFDKTRYSITPLLVAMESGTKVLITESDLESYPGMFLTASGAGAQYGLRGAFAGIPSKIYVHPTRKQEKAVFYSDTIARTAGTRSFPWRIVAIADHDTQLPVNNMVWLLGSPNRIGDISWIKPGKVAWDWWNDWGITGVDFPVGINTATYKYFIDFASANGLEYIVLDEGWSKPSAGDIMSVIPEIDLKEIVEYGRSKNVGVILWAVAFVLDEKLEEACRFYSGLGVKGFKIDFMDRDDQKVVELNYRILDMAARYHLVIDYHGMYKPTGLNRTYPNLLNYEGVWGLEQMKWSKEDQMTYDVTFPYIRMMAGPVDYTQGAMRNTTKRDFNPVYSNPSSQGTRAHQVAAYVIFDSPLVMLADSPTAYMKEQETTNFIKGIPTVWDETRLLDGRVGEYIVTARRNGSDWYIAGITGWTERDIVLDLSFLEDATAACTFQLFRDGINAHRSATDYKLETITRNSAAPITIHLAPGGGFTIKLQ